MRTRRNFPTSCYINRARFNFFNILDPFRASEIELIEIAAVLFGRSAAPFFPPNG